MAENADGRNLNRRPVVDLPELLARVGNDRVLLRDLCEVFLAELPGMVATLQRALEAHDPIATSRAAHGLKGAVSIFGKGESFEKALLLENVGKENRMDEANAAFESLVQALEQLKIAVTELHKSERDATV